MSAGPDVSSAVEMMGAPTQRINRSDPPGFSEAAKAVTSTVSVRPSAGYTSLGRLNVSFSLPLLWFQAEVAALAERAPARALAIAAASLSLLSRSPSRQPAAEKRM